MRLLKKSPYSVLWLRSGHETAMVNLRRAAEAAGVAGSRLVFAGRLDHPRHLARHRLADFAVDTRHHTGGVTTLDALWAGLPVATLAGAAHSERTGASILSALGVAELIADDEPTYEALLERLALDPAWRRALAAKVAERRERSPLFDMKRLARHLEDAYRRMWQAVARGEAPKEIRVAP
jgi:predicted O-linked N-acetylglucosamine transferase (SPINDLY family)